MRKFGIMLMALVLALAANVSAEKKTKMICDFENEAEVRNIFDVLNMKLEFVPENATSGKNCMKITSTTELTAYPWSKLTAWTGVTADEKKNIIKWWGGEYNEKTKFGNMLGDWDDWDVLKIDVYNTEKTPYAVGPVLMDEKSWSVEKDAPLYEERWNGSKVLRPGKNTIEIENGDFNTETGRRIDLKKIKCFWFTLESNKTIYIDNMRLEKLDE